MPCSWYAVDIAQAMEKTDMILRGAPMRHLYVVGRDGTSAHDCTPPSQEIGNGESPQDCQASKESRPEKR